MELQKITKQVIDLQKQSIDNWHAALDLVEKQATSAVGWVIDQAIWMPSEGRQTIEKCMAAYSQERVRLKNYLNEGLAIVEKTFLGAKAPAKMKSKQPGETNKGDLA
jgi:hypothetical protein